MNIGDYVKVKEPFNVAFPDTYQIEDYHTERTAYVICGDREFEEQFLEIVNGYNNP